MASGPITSWQIDVETVADFIFLGSKITADGDCSHEIKKTLTPWKDSYDQPRQHLEKEKEISPGCSLEGLMLKLKLQYSGHLMQRADSLEKTLMLGKIEGRRRRG